MSDHYLLDHEVESLFTYLNGSQSDKIKNKQIFTAICHQQNLPVAEILAICSKRKLFYSDGNELTTIPACDIFIKPVRGSRGEETLRWKYLGKNQFENHKGVVVTGTWLTQLLKELSRRKEYLIQPLLTNHPLIEDLSNGALATVRIVTGRAPTGDVESIAATFKMPIGEAITCTYGLNSPVELSTGVLGRAITYWPICPGYDKHPDTDTNIPGRSLPDWPGVLELAFKAHHSFPEFAFIGWDIALTPTGPLLLEGNGKWDVYTVQKPQGVPLGKTQFLDICLAYIRNDTQAKDKYIKKRK